MADKNLKGWVWQVVDRWGWMEGDVANVPATVKQFKHQHPRASVRTFKRTIRAGGAVLNVVVVVAREKSPHCTCGEAYGKRPAYLDRVCAYCDKGVKLYV